jgi:hypothetical protein
MAAVDDFDVDSINSAVSSAFGRKSAPTTRTQSSRDQESLKVLQDEYDKQSKLAASGNASAARNLESLQREMKLKGGAPTTTQSPVDDFNVDAIGAAVQDAFKGTTKTEQKQKKIDVPLIATQFYNKAQETKKDFGASIASLADTTIGGILPMAGQVVQAASRPFTTPEKAQQYGQAVTGALEKPFGKALGVTESPAYQGEASRKIMEFIGENVNKGAEWIAQKTGLPLPDVQNMMGTATLAAPALAAKPLAIAAKPLIKGAETLSQWGGEIRPTAQQQMQQQFQAKGGMQSAGAAATTDQATVNAMLAKVSPELQNEIRATPINQLNMPALERHVEADTLPVPVRLTRGQATQDVNLLSDEMNMRGKNPELANRFNEQNGKLIENMNAIRDKAAPDVYGTNHIENAETVINAYKALDDTRTADISAKYKALEDAAGGNFPIDGRQFVANAEVLLSKKLKTDFLPPAIAKQLERYKNGEKMTFEQFEAMRTNLAAEMRKAERSGDGNAKTASSLVRQALEDLPLEGDAANLKPLANEARNAAKARFDLLKKDPAYDAAVNDAAPDKFINKYIIGGNKRDLEALTEQLGKGSEGHQAVSAAVVNWLKNKAGVIDNNGNFSQAGYNKALQQLDPRLLELVDGETAQQLRALGNVARYTQAQPRGSYVNQSNTFVAGAKELAKGGLEKAGNVVGFGGVIPLGTMTREALANRAAAKQTQESLKPGAGTKLSDLGK